MTKVVGVFVRFRAYFMQLISQQSDATYYISKVDSLRILNTTRERRKNLIIFERII
jgi:hypothetical protein